MHSPNKTLFLIAAVLLALTSACASGPLPEQTVVARPNEPRVQQNPTVSTAVVKTQKANVRKRPSQAATVVSTVSKGALLSLTSTTPVGPWYQIQDDKTGAEGWIHGNSIDLLPTAETNRSRPTSTSAQRPRQVSQSASETPPPSVSSSRPASGKSYVNVDGVRVRSPVFSDKRPTGASARCRDGSYSFSLNRRGTCSHHGGVAEWY